MAEQPNQEQVQQIIDALASGRKIEAIKIYRQATGKGLKEANDFLDAVIPELIEKDPEKYGKLAASRRAGCASVILLLITAAAAAMLYITVYCN
jgi:hypothetical protein